MSKTIRELATCIIDQQASVYSNDAGQGTGGPGMVDPETLAELVESGEIDDYEMIDGEEAGEIVTATLWAHRHDADDGTRWIVARRTDEGDCSPYRHYLLLWDTEQEIADEIATKCTKNHSGNHTMVWDSNTGVFECAGCGHIRLAREIAGRTPGASTTTKN